MKTDIPISLTAKVALNILDQNKEIPEQDSGTNQKYNLHLSNSYTFYSSRGILVFQYLMHYLLATTR